MTSKNLNRVALMIATTLESTVIHAQAQEIRITVPNGERIVTVCVDGVGRLGLLPFARATVSKMFAGIGVTIDWRRWLRDCPAQAIVAILTFDTPGILHPGALAYATPNESIIHLFCDRIVHGWEPVLVPHLLAHVLAHEISTFCKVPPYILTVASGRHLGALATTVRCSRSRSRSPA